MLETIKSVCMFIYQCACEYLLFLLIDLLFKGPLDRAVSERERGVLWALEGSILGFLSFIVFISSHRPVLLTFLTLLTFLYSLFKCDDSLKELGLLVFRCLRWFDLRFFQARCFARRQWRRWRLPTRRVDDATSSVASEHLAGRAHHFSPRMGPTQLFSPSGLTHTQPLRRRYTVSSAMRRARLQTLPDVTEELQPLWRDYLLLSWKAVLPLLARFVRSCLHALTTAIHFVLDSVQELSRGSGESVMPPRGLLRLSQEPLVSVNPLVMALAHCPLLHAALNRMRPNAECSVGQEAMFAALLPVTNALAAAGAAAEAGDGRGRPVNGLELRQALHRIDDRQRPPADLMEWLLQQLHTSCRETNRSPRCLLDLRFADLRLLRSAKVSQDELRAAQHELSQLLPVTSLTLALRPPPSPHGQALRRASAAALASDEWLSGFSELRQLLTLQTADVSLCASCGRPALALASVFVLRLPSGSLGDRDGGSLTSFVERALGASPRLCNAVPCACGANATPPSDLFADAAPGLLSPIGGAPSTPLRLMGGGLSLLATPTAQTSTPVGGWRCRGEGCCRRLLRRLPSCLLLALPPGAKVAPSIGLEIGSQLMLVPEEEAGGHYAVRAVVGACGVALCRLGNGQLWFECEDETVRPLETVGGMAAAWRQRGFDAQERLLLLERCA